MRPISQRVRAIIDADSYYRRCARHGPDCAGRITMEHALLYAGRQVDEAWAIVPLCVYHHLGAGLDKRINELLALRRATESDFKKYSRADWPRQLKWLEGTVGLTLKPNAQEIARQRT